MPKLTLIRSEGERDGVPLSPGTFGMTLFLVSLGVVFVASLVAYHWVRAQHPMWRDATLPPLPSGLWASTGLLIGASLTIHLALSAAKQNRPEPLKRWLAITLGLGLAFLAGQLMNWRELMAAELPPTARSLYAFTFYMMTALHAVHVVGGLAALAVVLRQALLGRYSSVNHRGVTYQVMYWHFLDVVWVVLFGTFLLSA